jgi:hypothetical protein
MPKSRQVAGVVTMSAPRTNLAVEAAEHIWTPHPSADGKRAAGGRSGTVDAAALRAADWLCLAAAPTFAVMALLAGVLDGGMRHGSPLSGMALMYLLMSVFHSAPWLKLVSPAAEEHMTKGEKSDD